MQSQRCITSAKPKTRIEVASYNSKISCENVELIERVLILFTWCGVYFKQWSYAEQFIKYVHTQQFKKAKYVLELHERFGTFNPIEWWISRESGLVRYDGGKNNDFYFVVLVVYRNSQGTAVIPTTTTTTAVRWDERKERQKKEETRGNNLIRTQHYTVARALRKYPTDDKCFVTPHPPIISDIVPYL